MPALTDYALLAFFSLGLLAWELRWGWPLTRAALRSGAPGVRPRIYRRVMAIQWGLTLLVAAWWAHTDRPWTALGIIVPSNWRLAASIAAILGTAILFGAQARAFAALPDDRRDALRERMAPRIGDTALVLPRTALEGRWFFALALTAGVCEELLYRGYAVWVLRPAFGPWGAAFASVVVFGAGHLYQGRRGALRATVAGSVLGALALALGSVVPGMIVHAIVDIGGGAAGRTLFGERQVAPAVKAESFHAGGGSPITDGGGPGVPRPESLDALH
jgi:membrane protease YdiL (CAAX protease family)